MTGHLPGHRRHIDEMVTELEYSGADGRIRFWGIVQQPDDSRPRYLRVVTLADGETVHNAFFDRGFREDER